MPADRQRHEAGKPDDDVEMDEMIWRTQQELRAPGREPATAVAQLLDEVERLSHERRTLWAENRRLRGLLEEAVDHAHIADHEAFYHRLRAALDTTNEETP